VTLIAALATAASLSAFPAAASANPITDALAELTRCEAWADEPGGDPVVGSGGAQCSFIHRNVVGTVCLVYNGITVASSCNPIINTGGGGSASTKPTKCLPGLWQTQVIIAHAHGPDTEVVSDPVLLTCLLDGIVP
jgi:hypothetical protein